MKRTVLVRLALVLGLLLVGCAHGTSPYSVSGTVTGVTGEGLLLNDSNGSAVFVTRDGRFVLENDFEDGEAYELSAAGDPATPAIVCTVTNGSGVIAGGNVDDVTVACSNTTFTVGGDVAGVEAEGLILESNGTEISLGKDGIFLFPKALPTGSNYRVTVAQAPEGQTCEVDNAEGTVGRDDVTSVHVTCS